MSRISRYVFREMLGPTLLGLLIYSVVLVMNLLLEAAELFIRRDLPVALVGQYIALSLPRILVLVIPMAVLLGVLVGIGRLSADGEITALRASGYSDHRLLAPVLLLGLTASLAGGLLFNFAVPRANYAQHQLNARIFLAADINREIQPRVFYERLPDMLIYADAASPADGSLQRILIYQRSPTGQEELSAADGASLQQQPARGAIEFHLEDVVSHSWQASQPDLYQVSRSEEQVIERPPDLFAQEMIRSLTAPPPRNLREQTVPELMDTLADLRSRPASGSVGRQTSETLVELHKKFSLPATSLVFALLGLPLALGHRRPSGRNWWGFVVSLLVIVVSYALLTAGEQLADRGVVPPWAAMWAGNLLFFLVAAVLLATGSRIDIAVSSGGLRRLARRPPRDARDAGSTRSDPLEPSAPEPRHLPSPTPRLRRFPSTIDRYLLRHLLTVSLFVALSLTALFSLFYAIELIDDMTRGDKPFSYLFAYLMYLQPQILFSYVLPISLCIGTLVSFALLARTHELTAVRAGGIGLFRVAAPFLMASGALAVASFAAHDAVLPSTNQEANQIRDQIRNRSPRSYRRPDRRWVFGTEGLLFNFSDFNRSKQEFQDLAVFRFQPGTFDIAERIFAARAIWENGAWLLQQGWSRRFGRTEQTYEPFATRRLAEMMDPPDYFVQEWKAPDQMRYRDLRRHVLDLERRGYDTRELRVGLYRKLAIPSVCVVMVLIGLPFALRMERRGPVFAIGVSIVIVFVYFGALQAFGKMGEVALLTPLLAAWAPNLLFAGAGLYLTAAARW